MNEQNVTPELAEESTDTSALPAADRVSLLEQQLAEARQAIVQQRERLEHLESWAQQASRAWARDAAPAKKPAPENVPSSPSMARSIGWSSPTAGPDSSRAAVGQPAGTNQPSRLWGAPFPNSDSPSAPAGPKTVRIEADLESLIGGNILNRIAVLALVLGLAFFLKIAISQGWITQGMRVLFGAVLGSALLAGGETTRRRGLAAYSHGLSGAGFAALYLSVYAAYGFYHLIGLTLAFGLLAGVTLGTVARAVSLDAEIVAALGLLSGFLTPIILRGDGAGPSTMIPIFVYLWALDAGVLAAAFFRNWKALKIGSLILTQLFFLGWMASAPAPGRLPLVLGAASVFFLLYVAIAIVSHLVGKKPAEGPDLFLIIENPAAYATLLALECAARWPQWLGLYSLALAALYAGLALCAVQVSKKETEGSRGWSAVLAACCVAVSTGFLTEAVGLLLLGNLRTLGWDVEAAALLWGGCYAGYAPLRSTAYVLYGLLGIILMFLLSDSFFGSSLPAGHLAGPLLNRIEIPFALAILSAGAGAEMTRRYRNRLNPGEALTEGLLGASTACAGFIWLTIEVICRLSPTGAWLSAVWTLYAVALIGISQFRLLEIFRWLSRGAIALVLVKLMFYDAPGLVLRATEHSGGPTGFELPAALVIVAALFGESLARSQKDEAGNRALASLMASTAYGVGLWWLTLEILIATRGGTGTGVSAWISAGWSVYAALLLSYGILSRRRLPRLGALALLAVVIAKVFLFDIWSLDYGARVVSLFTLAGALWAASYLYARYRDRIRQLVL
ncbi:MAG TPA: DUF2339 domain-containing protein [Armatimonadota bacterium]|nr:DUF2339 domain-containing protein [Armatimonadota bacterium]